MLDTWHPIFNHDENRDEPEYAAFKRQFPASLPADPVYSADRPFQVPELVPSMIQQTVNEMLPCAPCVDGWQVHEVKALGPTAVRLLAKLYVAIETHHVWPSCL